MYSLADQSVCVWYSGSPPCAQLVTSLSPCAFPTLYRFSSMLPTSLVPTLAWPHAALPSASFIFDICWLMCVRVAFEEDPPPSLHHPLQKWPVSIQNLSQIRCCVGLKKKIRPPQIFFEAPPLYTRVNAKS